MNLDIQKIETDLSDLEEHKVKTLDEFAGLLYFTHKVEKYVKRIKDRLKVQGSQLMENEATTRLIFPNFTINKTEGSESVDYDPATLIEILGMERAKPFLSVNNTQFKPYLESLVRYGAITQEQDELLKKTAKNKRRKGSLIIKEIVDRKLIK